MRITDLSLVPDLSRDFPSSRGISAEREKQVKVQAKGLRPMGLLAQNANPCNALISRLTQAVEQMDGLGRDVPGRQVQVRLGHEVIDQMVADYESGSTVDELAESYCINRTTVMGHLRREGVQTRRKLRKSHL